jgi:hypothetical protein
MPFLPVAQKGFPPATFYYQQPYCGGFPFLPFDPETEILPTAVSIEGLIYGLLTSQFNTYTFASKGVVRGNCVELAEPVQLEAAPAFNSQSAFKPPFTVKP